MIRILNRSINYLKGNVGKNLLVAFILIFFIGIMATSANVIGIVINQNIEREAGDLQRMYFSYKDEYNSEEEYFEQEEKLNDPEKLKQIDQLDWIVTKSEVGSIYSGNNLTIENNTTFDNNELSGVNDYQIENDWNSYTEDSMEFSQEQIDSGDFVIIIPQFLIDNGTYSVGQKINIDLFTSLKQTYNLDGDYSQEFEIIGGYEIVIDDRMQKEIDEYYDGNVDDYLNDMSQSYYIPFKCFDSIITELENDPGYQSYLEEQTANSDGINENEIFYESTSYFVSGLLEADDPDALSDLESIYGEEMTIAFSGQAAEMEYIIDALIYVMVRIIISFGILTIFLLGAIIFLVVRNRQKEIGILFALGENKKSIYLQVLTEIYLLAIPILIIFIPLSYFIASIIIKFSFNTFFYFDQSDMTITSHFDIILNLGLIAFVIIIILLSTLIPIVYILRLKPKKILL